VEDGSREKVYTGESYPKRDYLTEITLRNGQVHRGDIVAVLYVYPEGVEKPKRAFLRKREQGEIGETLDDLAYVETVQFAVPAPREEAERVGILLAVSPAGAAYEVHALPRERDRSVAGAPDLVPGLFRFPGLLPGRYDLAVVTDREIFLSLAVGREGGRPLTSEELAEVRARVAEIADFFEDREVLQGVREGEKIRILVRKTRTGPTSMGGERTFRRYEVWSLHRGGDRWLVDNRSYLWREHGEQPPPLREVILTEKLGSVDVDAEVVEVRFEVPGRDGR
jgi:hypothetical protein